MFVTRVEAILRVHGYVYRTRFNDLLRYERVLLYSIKSLDSRNLNPSRIQIQHIFTTSLETRDPQGKLTELPPISTVFIHPWKADFHISMPRWIQIPFDLASFQKFPTLCSWPRLVSDLKPMTFWRNSGIFVSKKPTTEPTEPMHGSLHSDLTMDDWWTVTTSKAQTSCCHRKHQPYWKM